jgi:hypothetical protein
MSGARKLSGAPPSVVHLGGAWAQWDKQLVDARIAVEETARELDTCKYERDATVESLSRTAESLARTAESLAAAERACVDTTDQLSAERIMRLDEAESIRGERARFDQEMTAMREGLDRAVLDARSNFEKEEAANAMCEAAVADRDGHEEERISLVERVRSDAHAMEAQRLEIGRLQAGVRTLEKHSELLLKEKHRLALELQHTKRSGFEGGAASYHAPVSHLPSYSPATQASSSQAVNGIPVPAPVAAAAAVAAASPFTPSPSGGAEPRSKTAARRPASAGGAVLHDSPASMQMHDSPASMLKTICFTPRRRSHSSPSSAGKASDATTAALPDLPPPSKEKIAERKAALTEASKAALARAGRKPLLSAVNKAEVTAGAIGNPWMQ